MAPAVRTSKRKADAVDANKPEEKPTTANTSAPRKGRKIATAKPTIKAATTKTSKKPVVAEKTKTKSVEKVVPAAKPKKAPVEKKEPKKAATPPPSSSFNASQSFGSEVADASQTIPRKKGKTEPSAGPIINSLPTTKLNVYAFGTGDNAELGLGPEPNAKVVKRPRLNTFLLPDVVGVVAVAIGGMHGLALTHEGKVYSWGVNDQYALGRESKVAPREKLADGSDDSDEDDEPLNALESTPMPVEGFPVGTVITRIAAGDSVSVAVTDQGRVYAWGTFRVCLPQPPYEFQLLLILHPVCRWYPRLYCQDPCATTTYPDADHQKHH